MSYSSAIEQLNAMTPELFTQPGHPRRKFSLEEIGILLAALGNPHWRFPSILIAGTNGKGSTAATLASILGASSQRTGLYTSPHLTRPNERIRVNGIEISDDEFAAAYFRVHKCAQQLVKERKLAQLPSFFEHLTAMAFLHFANSRIDLAVLEVGMGGRLDATNIVDPLLSIITDISLDHTEWLGPTIAAITREKAGIMRRNGTLITLPQHPEANQTIGEIAAELGVRAISAVPYMPQTAARPSSNTWHDAYYVQALGTAIAVASPLHGEHQHRNLALAIAAAVELAYHHGVPVTPNSIAAGIHNTRWPGRLERITTKNPQTHPATEWILDVAHNPAGAWALRRAISHLSRQEESAIAPASGANETPTQKSQPETAPSPDPAQTLIFSCLRDKPVNELAQILFPLFDRVIFAPIHSSRATPMQDLLAAAALTGTPAIVANSIPEALDLAENPTDVIPSESPQRQVEEPAFHEASIGTDPGAPHLPKLETWERNARNPTADTDESEHEAPGAPSMRGSFAHGRESTNRRVVISGSVYLVGEARPLLLARTGAPADGSSSVGSGTPAPQDTSAGKSGVLA
jgi:dihydrofolate synthase / folylpolyglutamate synthase